MGFLDLTHHKSLTDSRCRRWKDSASVKVRSYLKDGYAKKNWSRGVSSDGTELLIVEATVLCFDVDCYYRVAVWVMLEPWTRRC
jgi:hypothetical protein